MGDARRRRVLGLPPRHIRPEPPPVVQRHVLAMIDRRMEPDGQGEVVFSDHSAKPGMYASADLKTLYQWDGTAIRRLDRLPRQAQNVSQS